MAEFPLIESTQFEPDDEYRPEPEPEPQPPAWTDGSLRIGIHTSIAGSYLNALESARKLGCNAMQIFSASPRMWQGAVARIPESDAKAFGARRSGDGAGDCHDCGKREASSAAGAAAGIADLDREYGGDGHGGGVAAGRSGADCARAARFGCRRVPGHGAPVRGGVRHSQRRRTGEHDWADRAHDRTRECAGVPCERFEDPTGRARGPARAYRQREDRRGGVCEDFAAPAIWGGGAGGLGGTGVFAGDAD